MAHRERDEERVYLPDPDSVTHERISEDEWLKVVAPHYPDEYPQWGEQGPPSDNPIGEFIDAAYRHSIAPPYIYAAVTKDVYLEYMAYQRRHNVWYRRLWRWVREWWVMDEEIIPK